MTTIDLSMPPDPLHVDWSPPSPRLSYVAVAFVATYVTVLLVLGRASLVLKSTQPLSLLPRLLLACGEVGVLFTLGCAWFILLAPTTRAVIVALAACVTAFGVAFGLWFRAHGLLAFMSPKTRKLLLHTSLLEWFTDRTFFKGLEKFRPLLLKLSHEELTHYLEVIPPDTRSSLLRRGLIHQLPPAVARLMLPAAKATDAATPSIEDAVAAVNAPPTAAEVWQDNLTQAILAKRVVRAARQFLLTADPPLTRFLSVAAVAALVFQLASSRQSRAYSLRVVKHGSMIGMLVAAVGLSSLAVSQVVAERLAAQPLASGTRRRDGLRLAAGDGNVRRTAAFATPAAALVVLFYLMQLRLPAMSLSAVGRRVRRGLQ